MPPVPAVCVPGTLCDARVFEPMLAHCPLDATVARLAVPDVAGVALDILQQAPPRFLAIGFSLGGFVVLELVRRAPDRLLGAVLIASHDEPDSPAAGCERQRQARLFATGADALVDDLWPGQVGEAARARRDVRATILAMAQSFTPADMALQSALAASRPDSRFDGPARLPLLMLAGEDDLICAASRTRDAAARQGGSFVALPGAGHFVPLEAPEAAAQALASFLDTMQLEPSCCWG